MEEKLIDWINNNSLDTGIVINKDTDLLDGKILDSLGVISLIAYLQDDCGVDIDIANLNKENFKNVRTIIKMLGE